MSETNVTEATEIEIVPAEEIDTEETVEETLTAEMGTTEIIQALVEMLAEESTAYAIHTVINEVFRIKGVAKVIRPQMMYNYARNGLIVKGTKGTQMYSREQVYEFVTRYTAKHIPA